MDIRDRIIPRSLRERGVLLYYLATPVFFALDAIWGINFRIPFLSFFPPLKNLYYVFSFGCGLAMVRFPGRTLLIGLVESSINFVTLIASFIMGYAMVLASAMDGGNIPTIFTPESVLNFVASGTVFLTCFYNNPLIKNAPRW